MRVSNSSTKTEVGPACAFVSWQEKNPANEVAPVMVDSLPTAVATAPLISAGFDHFCSGTLSRQDFCEEWTQSCQIQPQLVQPLTVNASKSTQEAVTKRRSVMFQNMTGEAADF
jgi:hypothetical protein